jgi:2,4-dienoyl-CoA reductase-like NADH-dependent reductase (Old Yellow Enzyme family)
VLEVCRAVRRNWPADKPIFIRFSCTDYYPAATGGWDVEQTVRLCRLLQAEQLIDLVDCSAGYLTPEQRLPPEQECYQAHFAKAIRQQVPGMLTGAVGCITDPLAANQLLADGQADIVLLAREFLRNANWVTQAAARLQCPIDWMPQYARGKERR